MKRYLANVTLVMGIILFCFCSLFCAIGAPNELLCYYFYPLLVCVLISGGLIFSGDMDMA